MQFKLPPEKIDSILDEGDFEIFQRSKNQIKATRPFDYGKVHMRLKREKSRYGIKEHHHWLANIHIEHGLRPQRDFDSEKVQEFTEKYIKPYAEKRSSLTEHMQKPDY